MSYTIVKLFLSLLQAPAPPPLNKSITPVPPSPPALLSTPSHSPQRPRTSPTGSQHVPVADETDKGEISLVTYLINPPSLENAFILETFMFKYITKK